MLVYLVDKTEKSRHEKAKQWFEAIRGKKNYFVSIQNLREFANIALMKTTIQASEIVENMALFSEAFNAIFDSVEDVATAISLAETKRKVFWDAILVATMQRHEIKAILTENTKDFEGFKGIEVVNPLE